MIVIKNKAELRETIKKARSEGRSIGFVPTMGYLHDGHLSLVRRARQENDIVVVSIFVNPTQFAPHEDLDTYPRDEKRDLELVQAEKADIVFFPTAEALYPNGYTTYVHVEGLMSQTLCGGSRPIFFRGVATVVTKLFHMVDPDRAYFGQKDGQQVAVIKQMVKDLDFDLQIVVCPTLREADGLAMSSRNAYLSPKERSQACILSQALFDAQTMIENGERQASKITQHIKARIASVPSAVIDYVSVVDARTLVNLETLNGEVMIATAVKLGHTRLIDNIRVEV